MIREYEASVLSIEPRGDHQLATVRVQSLGTLAVEVASERGIQVGDVRTLGVMMTLGELVAREELTAEFR